MADDEAPVPNRTRHSVMRSPMSAEAAFLFISTCVTFHTFTTTEGGTIATT